MVWIPDDIWYAQQKAKGKGKGAGRKGGGIGGWNPDMNAMLMAQMVMATFGGQAAGSFQGGKGRGKVQGSSSKQAAGGKKTLLPDLPWKSRVAHAYGKEYKQPPTKDSVVYITESIEGGGFTCTLTCDKFSDAYTSEEAFPCKKLAEESAAMVALKAEFPSAYKETPAKMKKKGALGGAGAPAAVARQTALAAERSEGGGVKRKAAKVEDAKVHPQDPKSRLNFGIMLLAERPITKEDLVYTTEEKNGNAVCTLTINCFDKTFKGKPAVGFTKESKKKAEQNAAEAALKAYKSEIAEKIPEHQAKKEAKEDARKAEHAAKMEAKRAAGEIP